MLTVMLFESDFDPLLVSFSFSVPFFPRKSVEVFSLRTEPQVLIVEIITELIFFFFFFIMSKLSSAILCKWIIYGRSVRLW